MLQPVLKLLFNPNPIIHALHAQAEINTLNLEREEAQVKRRMEMESLYYEIIHNLVFELTRSGIEVKNLKMRVESLASRLEFNERRARALESVVVISPRRRPGRAPTQIWSESRCSARRPGHRPGAGHRCLQPAPGGGPPPEGPGQRSAGGAAGGEGGAAHRRARQGAPAEGPYRRLSPDDAPVRPGAGESPGSESQSGDGEPSTGSGHDPDQQ
jgi:hypothetical protein